jgi:hypothetical protein
MRNTTKAAIAVEVERLRHADDTALVVRRTYRG